MLNRIIILSLVFLCFGCTSKASEVFPVKYVNLRLMASFESASSVTRAEHSEIELMASNQTDRFFALPFANGTTRRHIASSAFLITPDSVKVPLDIVIEKSFQNDLDGKSYKLSRPVVRIPATSKGDLVEINYEYGIEVPDTAMYLPQQHVDNAIFTIRSKNIKLKTDANGFHLTDHTNEGGWEILRYDMLSESGDPAKRSGLSSPMVLATALASWDVAAKSNDKFFLSELARKIVQIDTQEIIPASILNIADSRERAYQISSLLYEWIVTNVQYQSRLLDPTYGQRPRQLEKTWERKNGDCKDFALLYIKLLSKFNIYAQPVLVASLNDSSSPRFSAVPSLEIFNHVIVNIPEIDVYVDPTLGPNSYLMKSTGFYANVFGLHLFTGEYKIIDSSIKNSKKANLVVKKIDSQWVGFASWEGTGTKQLDIAGGIESLNKKMTGEANPKFMEKDGVQLKPGTWISHNERKKAQSLVNFEYVMRTPPIDAAGRLMAIPTNIKVGAVMEFDPSFWKLFVKNPCFGKYTSREVIEIEGVDGIADGPGHLDFSIHGISREFTQRVHFSDRKLSIVRTLDVDENRVVCAKDEMEKHKEFFLNINESIKRTEASLIASAASTLGQ